MHVLFVCLGNICRSCAAEEIFRTLAQHSGLGRSIHCDSAGLIDYHEGELPDLRMRQAAGRRGYSLTHRSRPASRDDFYHFDLIVAMDEANVRALRHLAPDEAAANRIVRMADYLPDGTADHIPDPYYGSEADFEHVVDLLEAACTQLLAAIKPELQQQA